MTNSIEEVKGADVIFIIGSNTTENHPIIGIKIKQALKNGAKLVVMDSRKTELAGLADQRLLIKPGTDSAMLNGIMHVIINENLQDKEFIAERTEGYEELAASLERYTPQYVAEITGVPAQTVIETARLFARADKGYIIYCMGLTQHSHGTDNVLAVANLAMLTGNIGREFTGVNPLRGQNNVQGACDMGALPNVFTGYQPVTDAAVRAKFADAWGVKELPDKPGLALTDAINAAAEGKLKAMYFIGENPMMSDPDLTHVGEALDKLELLVVQDIFLSETAQKADVVLPAVSFAEKDGTFTNTERRIQRVRQAIPPKGEAKNDGEIISLLAGKMGYPMHYASSAEIMDEIARLTPSYAGVTFERLDNGGLQWPCPDKNHPGTKFLHQGKFSRGRGKFHAVEYQAPAEAVDSEYPLILTTGRTLFHYHTGTMTRRVTALNEFQPHGWVEINPRTAGQLGIQENDLVRVVSRRGAITVPANLTEKVNPDTVFIPFHFVEEAANQLTIAALDPVARIPEYKVCAVRVEKLPG